MNFCDQRTAAGPAPQPSRPPEGTREPCAIFARLIPLWAWSFGTSARSFAIRSTSGPGDVPLSSRRGSITGATPGATEKCGAFTGQELGRGRRETELTQAAVAADGGDRIIAVFRARPPAPRRRYESFRNQITHLPRGDAGAPRQLAHVHAASLSTNRLSIQDGGIKTCGRRPRVLTQPQGGLIPFPRPLVATVQGGFRCWD